MLHLGMLIKTFVLIGYFFVIGMGYQSYMCIVVILTRKG